jgi:hypothetical protein
MRVIYGLLAVVIVLGWLGFELRHTHKDWSRALYTIAVFVFLMLVGAFFGLYGS